MPDPRSFTLHNRAPFWCAWKLACALCAVGCAGSQAAPQRPAETAAPASQLRMREPDAVAAREGETAPLGALAPVKGTGPQAEPPLPQEPAAPAHAPAPIRLAPEFAARPYALRDGQLVLPGGVIIHNVPKGVAVRSAQELGGGEVWEMLDARGRRLSLLKVESLGRGALPQGALLPQTAPTRAVVERSDWGAARVKVISERFLDERHIVTIERRAEGTGWIASGLEFGSVDER